MQAKEGSGNDSRVAVGLDLYGNGPLMKGSVAYCSQVPWIVAGTIRVCSYFRSKRRLEVLPGFGGCEFMCDMSYDVYALYGSYLTT